MPHKDIVRIIEVEHLGRTKVLMYEPKYKLLTKHIYLGILSIRKEEEAGARRE